MKRRGQTAACVRFVAWELGWLPFTGPRGSAIVEAVIAARVRYVLPESEIDMMTAEVYHAPVNKPVETLLAKGAQPNSSLWS